jgi:XTP/dITP diphosphohydrolase
MEPKNMTIAVASRNQGKIREIKRIFSEYAPNVEWTFLSAADLAMPEIDETGKTFMENARIKALAGARHSGMICLGEDSGLEVDKLDGAPGVSSHRFSETGLDDDNNALLMELLQGVPREERSCRYRCAIALADPQGILAQTMGSVEGIIHDELVGTNGFGYDPLFYAVELGKTLGEASDAEKDGISHRRRAIERLIPVMLGRMFQNPMNAGSK